MTKPYAPSDRWHELLTTRYVCEICLTRFFVPYRRCPACDRFGHIRPLVSLLSTIAHDDEELRQMIAQGQTAVPGASPPDESSFSI
jgi:hypothetical protein